MAVVGVGVAPVGVGFGDATPSKERDSGMSSGGSDGTPGDRHWGGMQAGYPGIRAGPGVPPGWMASVSAAKVPQSRRAGAHRAAGGFAADLPRRAGVGRGSRGGGRAYRRQKSVPGRAPRWRQTSEPGYHPHRLRYGTDPRNRPFPGPALLIAGRPTLPDQHHLPRKSVLLGETFGFASTGPENLRPSTRHRNLHRPPILTSTKQ